MGCYRVMVHDERTLGVQIATIHGGHDHRARWFARGEPCLPGSGRPCWHRSARRWSAIAVKRPRLAPLTLITLGLALAACAPAAAPSKPAAAAPAAPAGRVRCRGPGRPGAAGAFDEQAIGNFYRGKTIRLVVGYAAGSSFDLHARVVGRYLSQYMPGNPNVIVENKSGAGGFVATNLFYASDPKDGTVINLVGAGLPLQQALGKEGIQFDVSR